MTNDEAYQLVMAVASGRLDDVADLAVLLLDGSERRV